jgi:hypothetical protein
MVRSQFDHFKRVRTVISTLKILSELTTRPQEKVQGIQGKIHGDSWMAITSSKPAGWRFLLL